MVRVAKPNVVFLLVVSNSGFLIRRLGFYSGTHEAAMKEEAEWQELFKSCQHEWEPHTDTMGEAGRFCNRCLGFVRNEDFHLLFPGSSLSNIADA